MIVLDTNVVSELMRQTPEPRVVAWIDRQLRDDLHTTAVSIAEILVGIERLPASRRKSELSHRFAEMLARRFPARVLDFDRQAAEQYATIAVRREKLGRRTEVPDAMIAAICRTNSATLVTRNARDFEETGIELVNPWEA